MLIELERARFVDIHNHLTALGSKDEIKAKELKIAIVSVSIDKETSFSAIESKTTVPFVGVHPSKASYVNDLSWLEKISEKASGIGEIGLDEGYDNFEKQREIFEKHLEIAEKKHLPVQIHSRNSEKLCIDILKRYSIKRVLMHWFSSEKNINEVVSSGYFVSFSPALIYSKKLSRIAEKVSNDLILTESDFPTTYAPLSGSSNYPLIPSIIFRLSRIKNLTFDEMREKVLKNSTVFLSKDLTSWN